MNKIYFKTIANNDVSQQIVNRNVSFLKNITSALLFTFLLLAGSGNVFGQAQTSTFATAGTDFWLCPAGVTSITVKCYGGGGNGGRRNGSNGVTGGGGGGAYASKINLAVTPGTIYTIVVGAGGTANSIANAGGDSYFNTTTTVMAKGGAGVANNTLTGGQGGQAAACVGDVGSVFSGGNGGTGAGTNAGKGGGGAGTTGAGVAGGTGSSGGTGTATGGGDGGNGSTTGNVAGSNGSPYGGGGGGARRTSGAVLGGAGASGAVIIEWTGAAYVAPPTLNISTGSTTLTSSTLFFDDGGRALDYTTTSTTLNYTVYPSSCNNLSVTFNSFAVEACCDNLKIYNGNSTSAPLLGTYTASPGTITSSAADGSLTFSFTADGSVYAAGWSAILSNVPVSAPSQPSSIIGTLDPEVGASETYSVTNVTGVTYTWSFPSGWVINSGQGTNSVSVTVGATNGTISVTPNKCSLNGTARTASTTIPNYRWKYVSSSLGSTAWTGGEARNLDITIKNTGVVTWNSTYANNIGVRWNSTASTLAGTPWDDFHSRVTVGSLAPGASGTFTLPIEAKNATAGPTYGSNLTDGTYYLAFDVVSEGQCWFNGNTGTCGPGNVVFYSAAQTIASVPTLTVGSLTAFGSVCANSVAGPNSFTISGVNLTNDVVVNALSGYTYSTTSGGTYTSTLTLTPSSGSISQTVFVKFSPTADATYNGNISVSSTGVTSQDVAVTGTGVLPADPTVSASPSEICVGQTSNLNGTSAGNFIQWWDAASSGNFLGSTASGSNLLVSPTPPTTYYAEAVSGSINVATETFNYSGSIVNWTVPAGVTSINVDARGAQGGSQPEFNYGGRGARIVSNSITVTPGQVLKILVGQAGTNGSSDDGCGGGGGTFLTTNTNTPIVIAGGGGGDGADQSGINASLTETSTANGDASRAGSAGPNGGLANDGSGGGGLTGNGANGASTTSGGNSFTNGGTGGVGLRNGGFGGGGAGGTSTEGAGGGGGYAGGPGGASGTDAGGGGSSYSIVSPTTAAATQTGNGQIIITYNLPAVTGCYSNRVPVVVASTPLNAPTFTNNTPQCGPGIPTVTFAGNNSQPTANLNWFDAPTGGNNVNATAFTGSVTTTHYSNDFSSSLTSGSVTGTVAGTPAAAIVSGAMQITANATSQVGGFSVPATGVDVDAHQFSFKLSSTAGGADGFSFNFGNDIGTSSATAEQGSGSKLSVCFDIYDPTGPNSQGIRVKYAGTELAYSSNVSWVGGTNVPVVIDITNSGSITVTVNSVVLISSTQLPAAYLSADKSTWTFGYFARSGGIAGLHTIDDVDIKYAALVSATNLTSPISSTSTYYVSETVAGCTTSRTAVTVDYSDALPSTPGTITGTATQCPAQTSQTYSVSAISGANSYTWTVPTGWSITAGAATNSITVTTGSSGQNGDITVTATNFCGTSAAATLPVSVSVIPACIATFSPADGATNQSAVGITLSWTAVSGATGYDVYVDGILVATNQATTSYTLASVSVSTTYTWKVVPRNCAGLATGCSTYSFTTASSTCTPPSFTLTPTNILCFGATTGSIDVSASGGVSPYQYSIDNGLSYQSSTTFSSLGQGTYNIIVKGDDDCVSLPTETILTQPASAVSSTASGSTSGCDNTVVTLTGSGSGGTGALSYLWTPSTGLSSTTVASPSLTITGTVAYSLKVTDANGCFANSTTVNITSNTPAAPSVSATPSTICSGESTNLNAVSIGNYINWWDAAENGNQIASGLLSGSDYAVIPSTTSTYFAETFTATVGSLTTETFNFSGSIVNWTVPAGVTSINVDARGAQGGIQVESNAFGPGNGARIVGTISVTPGQVLKLLVGGQPSSAGSDEGAGGGGGSFLATSANVPLIVAGGGGGEGADAAGDNASLTTNGTTPNTGGAGGTGGNGGNIVSVSTSTGSGGGGFTGNGTGACTNGQGLSFVNGGTAGISCGGSGSAGGFGGGGGGSAEGAGGGGGYSGGGGGNSATDGGGGGGSYCVTTPTTAAATQTGNGQIVITYTPVIIGCTSNSRTQVTLNVNALPTITSQPASGTQSVCQNGTTTNLSVSTTAGSGSIATYQWYSNTTASTTGGTLVATNTTTDLTNTYLPSSSAVGTLYYYVVVTNSNGCSITSAVSGAITITPTPTSVTATASSNTVCSGDAINLTSSATYSNTVTETLLSPSGDGGFETGSTFAANNWTMAATGNNLWYVGTAVVNSGTRAAYISSNASAGAAATYSTGAARVSHLYRDVTFPVGATNISLTFNWQGVGESSFDYTRVHLVPTSTTPIAGTALSSGQLGGNLNGQSTWQSATISLSNANAGTTQRLVFSWINDGSTGTAPAGVIDNVSITATVPETPTYTWSSNPAGFTSSQQNPTNVIPTENTVYTVTVSNVFNCSATASTTTVTSLPLFTSGAIATTGETICVGVDQANITSITASSGGDNSIIYEWRANGTPIASTNSAAYDPGLATTTTTYTRWAKDATCNTTFTQSTGSWVVTVESPSSVSTLANGDFLWTGTTGSDWATTANWRQWNGSAYVVPSGFPNSATANVFLPSVTGCVANAANLNASTISVNNMTIESGSTFTLNNASAVLNIAGGITNNGTWSTPTIGSTVNYNGSGAQTITALTYDNLQTSTSGTKTLASGTTTANGVVTIGSSSTLDLGANSLNLAYVGTPMVISGTFTPSTGTVNYVGNGNQGVVSTTYNHLNVNLGSGTATAAGSVTTNGNLTLTAGDLDLAGNDLNIGGNLTNNSNLVNAPNVLMNGSGSQIIAGSTPTTFEILQLVGGTGTTTVNQDIVVNQVLYVETGNTLNGGTSEISFLMSGDPFILEGSFVSGSGTVNYAAADVTNILPLTYYNLKSLGAAIKTLIGNTTVSNQLNLDESILDVNTFVLTLAGSGASSPVVSNGGQINLLTGELELTNTSAITLPASFFVDSKITNLYLNGVVGLTTVEDLVLLGNLNLNVNNFDIAGNKLTIDDGATITTAGGLIDATAGTIVQKGDILNGNILVSNIAKNLEIDRASGVELNGNLEVTEEFKLTDGTLDIAANTLKLDGTLDYTAGGLDADNGTIDFDNATEWTLPTTFFSTDVKNLLINGVGGVSLSESAKVSNQLDMNEGNITVASGKTLEIGTNVSTTGTINWTKGSVVGQMKRWYGTAANATESKGIFPVGTPDYNRYVKINFTEASSGGYVLAEYKTGLPDNMYELPLMYLNPQGIRQYIQNADETGYWDITPYDENDVAYASLDDVKFDMVLRINNPDAVGSNGPLNDPPTMRIIRAKGNPLAMDHEDWSLGASLATISSVPGSIVGTDYTVRSVDLEGFSWFNIGGDNSTPLPIELISFTGSCNNNGLSLVWKTASEFNSSYYIVEKSADGENWREINNQAAAGFSTEVLTYQFMDESKKDDNAYYRLTQFDIDGEFTVYDPIFVSCEENSNFIKTYPNPSDASFQVLVNNSSLVGKATIQLVDTKGTIVSMKEIEIVEGTNLFYLNEEVTPGIYYLSISNGTISTEIIKHSVK